MRKNASALAIAYFTFLLMIIFSGSLTGIFSETVYFLSYILPFVAVIVLTDREAPKMSEFSISRDSKRLFLPTVFPIVFVIIFLSFFSSTLISLFSEKTPDVDLGDSLLFAIFYNALLPSVLEELLFRYLPMRYIAPYSARYAVIFSAAFFALVHHSFFSMPYAFFAGAAFMCVNLLCESSLPSIILHFVNNSVFVVWSMYFEKTLGSLALLPVMLVPALACAVCIYRLRRRYLEKFAVIFSDKCEIFVTPSMFLACFASIFTAALELFA